MSDTEDASLVHIGHTIYSLLGKIVISSTKLSNESGNLQTWDNIVDEGERFKIWSASTGLLIPGHGSLDYRVRDAENLSKTFRSFLIDLRDNFAEVLTLHLQKNGVAQTRNDAFEDGIDVDDHNNDDDDVLNVLLESIKDINDRLFRLATKLRSPETRLRSSRAHKFQSLDNAVDLFECYMEFEHDFVSSVFQSLRKGPKSLTDPMQGPTRPDESSKFHVDDETSRYLIERIAHANVTRRRQFAYWKHHRLKLDKHTEAAITVRKSMEQAQVSNTPRTTIDSAIMSPGPAMTISTATQLLNPIQKFDEFASMASVSEYSPPTAGMHADVVTFPPPPSPPPPRRAADSKFFECPYCFTICAQKTANLRAWQAHLIHDLRPYICTYKDCRTPNQLYDVKSDWVQHETTSHVTAWKRPGHEKELLNDQVALQLHASDECVAEELIKGDTQGAGVDEETSGPGRACPVCAMSDLPVSQWHNHVAAHLERLAIFSFPKHVGTAETDDDDHDGSHKAIMERDSKGEDMESDLSFDSAPASLMERQPVLEEHTQRHVEETEQILVQELDRREKVLGRDHLQTLETLNSLSFVYRDQGRLHEAQTMQQQVLSGREKSLGASHRDTLRSMSDLAKLYTDQGRHEEAIVMLRETLSQQQKGLGKEHTDTLNSMKYLAKALQLRGNMEEAEEIILELNRLEGKTTGTASTDVLPSQATAPSREAEMETDDESVASSSADELKLQGGLTNTPKVFKPTSMPSSAMYRS